MAVTLTENLRPGSVGTAPSARTDTITRKQGVFQKEKMRASKGRKVHELKKARVVGS